MKSYKRVSRIDRKFLNIIRENVSAFIRRCGKKYDKLGYLLDIAPGDQEGAAPYFFKATIHTLDIDPCSGATYIADICKTNHRLIPNEFYDYVVCTEVLEHTLDPFSATEEIHRILKPEGLLFLSVPFNFRIHGPLPDCWRFTEHGLRVLLKKYAIVELKEIGTPGRVLTPIHYTVIAKKEKGNRQRGGIFGKGVCKEGSRC